MSDIFNYEKPHIGKIYDRERYPMGANIIAGLLCIHGEKPLKDLHILDAGCGTGLYTEALIELGVGKFTLLDASPAMLDFARQKLKAAIKNKIISDVIEAKLPFLPFHNGTFDAVMFNTVLHHLRKGDHGNVFSVLEETLRNTKRILRPKGLLVITGPLPAIERESNWFAQLSLELTDTLFQVAPTLEQYLDLFARCGFNCVAAVNLLSKATPCIMKNYFDSEGPLKRDWRIGTCFYDNVSEKEIERILSDKGSLKTFMLEHDRSSEFGILTLLVCVSV